MCAYLTDRLADFALDTRFEDLPAEVVKEAKRRLLDTLACAIGALPRRRSRAALPRESREILRPHSSAEASPHPTGPRSPTVCISVTSIATTRTSRSNRRTPVTTGPR